MFNEAPRQFSDFSTSWRKPDTEYALRDVRFDISDLKSAIFSAVAESPTGQMAWCRCWVSNAVEGTLAEGQLEVLPNQTIRLEVTLETDSIPELACIRIESEPLATEHTLCTRLCKGKTYFQDQLRLVLNSAESLREMIDGLDPETHSQMSQEWVNLVQNAPEPIAWIHGFAVFDRENGERVGSGGFKGPPNDGMVEIAYGIDEPFRCRGFATSVARALTSYAFGQGDVVEKVIAHTLPEENASTRVLTKCGFVNLGEVVDPEDGPVWRWEKVNTGC